MHTAPGMGLPPIFFQIKIRILASVVLAHIVGDVVWHTHIHRNVFDATLIGYV